MLYIRIPLSLRKIEDLLDERGLLFSHRWTAESWTAADWPHLRLGALSMREGYGDGFEGSK